MNRTESTRFELVPSRLILRWGGMFLGTVLLSLAATAQPEGEATVRTLGGGRLSVSGSDAGFVDGDILQASQFNQPFGCDVDSAGRVYVADRLNGALRRLDITANRCRTLVSGLKEPIAVKLDSAGVAYILTHGDGAIWKVDRGVTTQLAFGLAAPAAMAFYKDDSLLVVQDAGTVVQVGLLNGAVSAPKVSGLNRPGGITVLESGAVAISETGGHLVRIWDAADWTIKLQMGNGEGAFADGPANRVRFNLPHHLATAPDGSILVSDRGNHRVRKIEADGFVTTIYGVDPAAWEGPSCTTCDPMILPGWFDGSIEFAEAREPVGVAVTANGTIYTTEAFYHLVREITGATFTGGGGGGGTNLVVLPPIISPVSGYYPMGQAISVRDPNVSPLLSSAVFYTTDGSEPTTNSLRVAMEDGIGTIFWQEKRTDLASLRVKAFLGNSPSETVSGRAVSATEIGVPQDVAAGIGSTAILPVVLNLRTNDQLQSLQFRVEITPERPGIPMIPETLEALPISTNDFIPLFTAESKGEALFQVLPYSFGQTRGMAITFIGTNANLLIKGFAAAAMLSVPIPPSAKLGDAYTVDVLNPSGTADGQEQRVSIAAMPAKRIVVSSARYSVGDSSPSTWYNAVQTSSGQPPRRGFGDGLLENSDVNNAFSAALGIRVPYPHTDLFDSMDAFPEDTTESAGGDGLIRYLDWQIILMRSLGLDPVGWERSWAEGGIRIPHGPAVHGSADMPGTLLISSPPGAVWNAQATLETTPMEEVVPGTTVDLPVYVRIAPGSEVRGLAFRAAILAEGNAPPLERPVTFVANPNLTAPRQVVAPFINSVLCGWPLVPSSSFNPALRGGNLLGHIRVAVPPNAQRGDAYTLRFSNADGSPDLRTQYQFDSKPASVWVASAAQRPPATTSDEWTLRFFGSLSAPESGPDRDPDDDGVVNAAEYLAGTHPADGRSFLRLTASVLEGPQRGVVLRWLSAPGKQYLIETAPSLLSANWTVVASDRVGDGFEQEWVPTTTAAAAGFYRIRLQSENNEL